ncbi:hypothetical protein Q4595_14880 [Wenyingzhuangia sp. 1_MG-2023]|nr:hypothetical protein [Wenyingzhuangia sp. 1_MG-2023]
MIKKIELNSPISDEALAFFCTLHPLNHANFDYNINLEIAKFLKTDDKKSIYTIRHYLIWNDLIEFNGDCLGYAKYRLTNKGVNFIKQEVPDYESRTLKDYDCVVF